MNVLCASPWIPAEYIRAHGLPCRGTGSTLPPSLPSTAGVCAYAHQVGLAARHDPGSLFILPTSCDQLRRVADASSLGATPPFLFNLPATRNTTTAKAVYRREVLRLGEFLVAGGGTAPSSEQLRQEMEWTSQQRERLLRANPSTGARHFAEGVLQLLDGIEPDLPKATNVRANPVPLAVVGGPLVGQSLRLLDLIEEAGGKVVLNGSATGERAVLPPFNTSALQHDPLAHLVDHYWQHCLDISQRPNTRLHEWLKDRIQARHARGVIVWQSLACDLWRAEVATLRENLDCPVLSLDGHTGGVLSIRETTRLHAFIEMLQ